MSWLSSFLHPERGYNKARDEYNKYYDQAQMYQQPFLDNATGAYGGLSEAMKALLDPQGLQDKWASGYEESDAAKNAENMATQHGLNAASSMGMLGSTPALQALQTGTSNIVSADKQHYLDDLMKKYLSGIGIGEDIYGVGASSAGQMGQNAMTNAQRIAEMVYNSTNAPGQTFGNIAGMGANLFGNYLTGGMGTGSYGRGAWKP